MCEVHQKHKEEMDVAEKTGKGLQNVDDIELNTKDVKVFQPIYLSNRVDKATVKRY